MYQKSKFLWLFLIVFLYQPINLIGQCKLDYDLTLWEEVFVDEFDYNNATELLNSGFWRTQNNDICDDDGDPGVPARWDTDQIVLDNGLLRLKATELDPTESCPVTTGATIQYKIGGIQTGGLNAPEDQYNDDDNNDLNDDSPCSGPGGPNWVGFYKGMFEIRCKLPVNDFVFPAFWLYNGPDEIDIMEYLGNNQRFTTNVIDNYGANDSPELPELGVRPDDNDTTLNACLVGHRTDRDIESEFHTFTLVWTGDGTDAQLTFFFDGKEIRTETRYNPWDCPLGLLLNMSVRPGANFANDEFVIDYVRVYRQAIQNDDYMYNYEPSLVGATFDASSQTRAMTLGANNRVYYRNTANRLSSYYLSGGNYVYGSLMPSSTPSNQLVQGDIAITDNEHVIYRGGNGKVQSYYWSTGGWTHGWIDNSSPGYLVSSACGALSTIDNDVVYRGSSDNKMHRFYWSSGWVHQILHDVAPGSSKANWLITGDVVGGANQWVFYRGADAELQVYYPSGGGWAHADIDWYPSGFDIHAACGSIAVNENNEIFFRGTDNRMHRFYSVWPAGGDNGNGWNHEILPGDDASQEVAGEVVAGTNGRVYYKGSDGRLQFYYESFGHWYHGWVNESGTGEVLPVGGIESGVSQGQDEIFYRDLFGDIRRYTWEVCSDGEVLPGSYTCGDPGGSPIEFRSDEKEEEEENIEDTLIYSYDISVVPNPFTNNGVINFELEQEQVISASIFSIEGKEVLPLFQRITYPKGKHQIPIDSYRLNTGLYILQFTTKNSTSTVKFVKE